MRVIDRDTYEFYGINPAEAITEPYDWSESWEDFEIRQAFEAGDIDRVHQLLSLKGTNDFM